MILLELNGNELNICDFFLFSFLFSLQETERESHSERERIRSQIRELRGQQTQQSRELQRIGEMHVLILPALQNTVFLCKA